MRRHLILWAGMVVCLSFATLAHSQTEAQTEVKAGIDVGNVAMATRKVEGHGTSDGVAVKPGHKLTSQITVKGQIDAHIPGLHTPPLTHSVEKTIDLKDVLKGHKAETKARANPVPNPLPHAVPKTMAAPKSMAAATPVPTIAPAPIEAKTAPQPSATPSPASGVVTSIPPTPPPGKTSINAGMIVLSGGGLIAALAAGVWFLVPGGIGELANHALSHLRGPRIRAEGKLGDSHIGPIEFSPDEDSTPRIGIIVRRGPVTNNLSFIDETHA